MESRRQFLKKGVYVAPVVMTLAVRPALARNTYCPKDTPPPCKVPPLCKNGGPF